MVSITGAYLSTSLVSDSLEERFTGQLIEAASVAADGLGQREQLHLSTFRAIAFTEGIDEAILTNNRERIETLVFPHIANNNIGQAARNVLHQCLPRCSFRHSTFFPVINNAGSC